MKKIKIAAALVAATLTLFACQAGQHGTTIELNGDGAGRVFDGLGALSAGASSRLLVDYHEPERSQILDYLFKPDYGASLQHLKVEIGSDVNSTDGSEPSFARARAEMAHPNFNRGYEWWLMEEAVKRNPHIALDSLAWGAPGWIGHGHYYSQDMADYTVKFLQGAKSAHNLDVTYTGIWNERPYEPSYVKLLKKTLLANGLSTKVVCCDLYTEEHPWQMIAQMAADPALREAIDVVGVHSPNTIKGQTDPDAAKTSRKPLWASEDEFFYYTKGLTHHWNPYAESLAMLYNRNYIEDRITGTEIWSPITSYYDNLPAPRSGLMTANTPWSGRYDVDPMIWVTAHTTQFAQPGWRYIDSACGLLKNSDGKSDAGSYVTLKSPDGGDYSVIVETVQAAAPTRVTFHITGGLSTGTVHVWETNADKTFEHVSDITPQNGSFSLTLDADSLYSLTTTTGQHKGDAATPAVAPFPFPYSDNFESTPDGRSPKYLSDQDGAFEVWPCEGRAGRCLRQVITQIPIPWAITPDPFTMLGDAQWTDYTVSVDARADSAGGVALMGRIDSSDFFKENHARWPSGYILTVDQNKWQLVSSQYKHPSRTLAEGALGFPIKTWRRLELRFKGDQIVAMIGGKQVASVADETHKSGMAAIGSGWNKAEFDNFAVK
ncbi:MAG TPA: family 16 glycoside hydrolase [Terriglobia bacterium]|nr:family 16 glycoside hydrolase [Terriglobia bacterium]